MNVIDYKTVKKRGGRKKRKRPLHDRPTEEQRCRNYNQRKPKTGKLFEPLKVTSDDSEEAVANEIAEKLNEVRLAIFVCCVDGCQTIAGYVLLSGCINYLLVHHCTCTE